MAGVTVAENQNALSGVTSFVDRARAYFADLRSEMRRVTWPSGKQVRATTAVVIVAVFLFAFYFAVVDMLFGKLITQIFQALTRR